MFKMGRIPWDLTGLYRFLVLLAASSFLGEANKPLLDVLKILNHDNQGAFGVFSNDAEHECLNNAERVYKIAIEYPGNRRYYILIPSLVFKDLIRSWMGYATSCYVLHFTSLDSTFVLFDSTQVLSVVNESDEELED